MDREPKETTDLGADASNLAREMSEEMRQAVESFRRAVQEGKIKVVRSSQVFDIRTEQYPQTGMVAVFIPERFSPEWDPKNHRSLVLSGIVRALSKASRNRLENEEALMKEIYADSNNT